MKYIFDTTPLIMLAKINLIHELANLPGEKIIPQNVYEELAQKKTHDFLLLEGSLKKGIFCVKKCADKALYEEIMQDPHIDAGEAEVLALAKEAKGIAIIDEREARSLAKIKGILFYGTIFILFRFLKKGVLTKAQVREKIDEMISKGWYCSTELYALLLQKIQ